MDSGAFGSAGDGHGLSLGVGATGRREGRGGHGLLLRMGIGNVVGTGNTQLCVVAETSDDADHRGDVTFDKTFNNGHLVDVNGTFALRNRCVVAVVDGADSGFNNLNAGGLQRIAALMVGENLSDGLHSQRKRIARGNDAELRRIGRVDARKLNKAVVIASLTVGLDLVAQSQRAHSAGQKQVDASGLILDVHVFSIDEDDDTLYQSVFVECQCLGFCNGDYCRTRLNSVCRCGNITVIHSFFGCHCLHR